MPRKRLILSTLQQSLGDLVLFDNVDVCAPTGQGVSVYGVEESL